MAVKKSTIISAVPKAPVAPKETPGRVDDVSILLTVLEDIRDLSGSLENCVDLFRKTSVPELADAASILDPISSGLALVVANDFPVLEWIRKDLVARGFKNQILGG